MTDGQVETSKDGNISRGIFKPQVLEFYLDATFCILKLRSCLIFWLRGNSEAQDSIRCL